MGDAGKEKSPEAVPKAACVLFLMIRCCQWALLHSPLLTEHLELPHPQPLSAWIAVLVSEWTALSRVWWSSTPRSEQILGQAA